MTTMSGVRTSRVTFVIDSHRRLRIRRCARQRDDPLLPPLPARVEHRGKLARHLPARLKAPSGGRDSLPLAARRRLAEPQTDQLGHRQIDGLGKTVPQIDVFCAIGMTTQTRT